MTKFFSFLSLIRFPNLVMIALAQGICAFQFAKGIPFDCLSLLMISTIFTAAGGYIINDIEDFQIDLINSEKTNTNNFQKKTLIFFYAILSFLGLSIGLYLYTLSSISIFILYLLAFLCLLVYAKYMSKHKLIGNVLISLLIVLSILIIPIFAKNLKFADLELHHASMFISCLMYAHLAFFINWSREIVKDMEDIKGDVQFGRKTIPLLYGNLYSKIISSAFLFIGHFTIMKHSLKVIKNFDKSSSLELLVLIILNVLFGMVYHKLYIANSKEQFSKVSFWLKILMFVGIILPLVSNIFIYQ